MIAEIQRMVRNKIKEIGFNFDPEKVFEKEMIKIAFCTEESSQFTTFKCIYYPDSESKDIFIFHVRFSRANLFIDYIDMDAEIHIYI